MFINVEHPSTEVGLHGEEVGLQGVQAHKKWPKDFSGKFGEIRAKILRIPKNLPAPTDRQTSLFNI